MRLKKFVIMVKFNNGNVVLHSVNDCNKAHALCEVAKIATGVTDIEVLEKNKDNFSLVVKESRRQIGF